VSLPPAARAARRAVRVLPVQARGRDLPGGVFRAAAVSCQVVNADALAGFHPLVAGWFRERFVAPTAAQREGWPRIAAGEDVLIAAPTGSGKTLAAFLACLDELVRRGLERPLDDRTQILYVSPLKALSNDVHRNLEAPLAELAERAARDGVRFPAIRVAV